MSWIKRAEALGRWDTPPQKFMQAPADMTCRNILETEEGEQFPCALRNGHEGPHQWGPETGSNVKLVGNDATRQQAEYTITWRTFGQ